MARPRQSTGRPGTPVILGDWEVAHAVVAEGTMRAEVSLVNPLDTGAREWLNNRWVTEAPEPYTENVPARVQRLSAQTKEVVVAEDDEVTVDFLVTIPWGMGSTREGHLVRIDKSTDQMLVGKTLRVVEVGTGSERFERDLFCALS